MNNIEWLNSTLQNSKIILHDVSIAAHSLYYIADLSYAIQKIYSVTKKRMYIVHGVNNDTLFHELIWEITREEPYISGPNYRLLCDVLRELDIEYEISFFNMIHELRFPSIESLCDYFWYNFDNVPICISKL